MADEEFLRSIGDIPAIESAPGMTRPEGRNVQAARAAAQCDFHATYECAKLIRKLRWIGMDEEAHRLELAVRSLAPGERPIVPPGPTETD